jgi:hypothetical protein
MVLAVEKEMSDLMKTAVDYADLVKRLRGTCQTLRRTPMAIADTILFLQESADAIEQLLRERDACFEDAEIASASWAKERDALAARVKVLEGAHRDIVSLTSWLCPHEFFATSCPCCVSREALKENRS